MTLPAEVQTVTLAVAFWAERTPIAPALLAPGLEPMPFGEVYDAANLLAAALRGIGLGRQDRIAVAFPEGRAFCLALLGAMAVGIAVPVAWPGPEPELRRVLADPQLRAVVAAAEAEEAVRPLAGPALPVLIAGESPGDGRFRVRGTKRHDGAPIAPPAPHDVAVILRSAGTTGRPKLIPRTHKNIASFCRDFIAARAVNPDDRGLSLARTTASQGLHSLMTTMFAGSSLAVAPAPDRRALSGWLREQQPTYLSTPPATLRAIAAEGGALREAALRCVFATSAPLPAEEAEHFEAAVGAPILNMYGLTEATAIAAERYPRERRVPGSVGPAWCEVRVLAESGAEASGQEVGEIEVRGPRVSPGYLDDPERTVAVFASDGWFRTGDLGFLDEMGYVHLRGRRGEIVNRGGDKIDPEEVDAVLRAYPGVDDAAAFSVPDPLLGEDIVAAIVLAADATVTARQLRAWALDHLASHKAPRRLWFVEELPRTANGKARRGVLRERFQDEGRG